MVAKVPSTMEVYKMDQEWGLLNNIFHRKAKEEMCSFRYICEKWGVILYWDVKYQYSSQSPSLLLILQLLSF